MLGRGAGDGEAFGADADRDGFGRAEDAGDAGDWAGPPSGTTRCPSRKYAYQAFTVRR